MRDEKKKIVFSSSTYSLLKHKKTSSGDKEDCQFQENNSLPWKTEMNIDRLYYDGEIGRWGVAGVNDNGETAGKFRQEMENWQQTDFSKLFNNIHSHFALKQKR